MTKYLRYLLGLFVLLLLSAACADKQGQGTAGETPATAPEPSVSSAQSSTELPFPVYNSFSDLEYIFQYQNDTTYVINFWATWCKPCVAELPYFEQLQVKNKGQKLKVILVSLDFAKDVETKLAKFVKQQQLAPNVIALTDGKYNDWIGKIHPDWGGAIPVTYIYKGSYVLFHDQQYDSYEELLGSVEQVRAQGLGG